MLIRLLPRQAGRGFSLERLKVSQSKVTQLMVPQSRLHSDTQTQDDALEWVVAIDSPKLGKSMTSSYSWMMYWEKVNMERSAKPSSLQT